MVRAVRVGSIPKRKIYENKYIRLKGVDFSTNPALVDGSRSPWAPNMIADSGGHPEKRPGWRTLFRYGGRINGIHGYLGDILVHAGTALYRYGSAAALKTGIHDARSVSFYFQKKLYLLTGREYLVYDGQTVGPVEGFVPTTHIGMTPATGAGTFFEDINLLTGKRTNAFTVPAEGAKLFTLDSAGIGAAPVSALVGGQVYTEGKEFSVDRAAGKVTFTAVVPGSNGADTVFLTFTKETPGARAGIERCTVCAWFGMGNDSRVFVSGNPDSPHIDYASYLYDPTYFPASGWTKIGSDASAIMGYIRQYEHLLIIKEDNGNQDASVYLRSADLTANGEAVFPIKQGVAGVGAVSKYAFAYLRDDPLFLARDGVSALTLAYGAGAQRTVQNRSYYINARLTKMALSEAVSAVWEGYYLLSVGGEVFLADSRQKAGSERAIYNETFSYEWYHWNNVPARVWFTRGSELYFGADDGRFCRFNTDSAAMSRYADDGAPIVASWMTKADDDGDFMVRKTLPKRGTGAMLKPFDRSSVRVYAIADLNGNPERREIITTTTLDIFDFNDVDFTRFSFRTSDAPAIIAFDTKIKKYSTLFFVLESDQVNEGFGLYGLIKRFVHGNYLKRGF